MADFEHVSQGDVESVGPEPAPPLDLSHHFSRVTANREASKIKGLYKYLGDPRVSNLAGGLPNASFFPFDTLSAEIAQPERFKPSPNNPSDLSEGVAATSLKKPDPTASAHLTIPHVSSSANPLLKIDLTTALQYGTAQGYPPLYSFLRQFTLQNLHPNIPYKDGAEIILTNGNTDGFSKALEAFTNTWSEEHDWVREREAILCEEFAYMSAVQSARPRGVQIVPVKMDSQGINPTGPGGLEDVLKNWDYSKGKRPHLMYTVTIGQNPTGGTLSTPRRKEIYALCSKYDIIIIEDDPYWYLQYPSAALLEARSRNAPLPKSVLAGISGKSSGYAFLDSLQPSYLSIDFEGRVVRLDTFSKTVAPGCRLGWITAQPKIIERMLRITETSTQQPSGFVQAMMAELIIGPQTASNAYAKKSKADQLSFSGWKADGWVRWLEGLRGMYERRMNRMATILDSGRILLKQQTPIKAAESDWAVISKTEMYSFFWPHGGMFVWLKLHLENHNLFSKVGGPKLSRTLWNYLASESQVLVAPGSLFSPTVEIADAEGWKYLRLCFAAVTEEEIDESSKKFTSGMNSFWAIKDEKDLPPDDEAMAGNMEVSESELVNLAF